MTQFQIQIWYLGQFSPFLFPGNYITLKLTMSVHNRPSCVFEIVPTNYTIFCTYKHDDMCTDWTVLCDLTRKETEVLWVGEVPLKFRVRNPTFSGGSQLKFQTEKFQHPSLNGMKSAKLGLQQVTEDRMVKLMKI